MVPPAAMIGNSRLPSDSVMMSLASDQNCAIDSVLKMPSQTKNANPTDTPALPEREEHRQADDEDAEDPLDQPGRLDPVGERAVGGDDQEQQARLHPARVAAADRPAAHQDERLADDLEDVVGGQQQEQVREEQQHQVPLAFVNVGADQPFDRASQSSECGRHGLLARRARNEPALPAGRGRGRFPRSRNNCARDLRRRPPCARRAPDPDERPRVARRAAGTGRAIPTCTHQMTSGRSRAVPVTAALAAGLVVLATTAGCSRAAGRGLTLAGSTSVQPFAEKWTDAYRARTPGVADPGAGRRIDRGRPGRALGRGPDRHVVARADRGGSRAGDPDPGRARRDGGGRPPDEPGPGAHPGGRPVHLRGRPAKLAGLWAGRRRRSR